MHDWLSPTHTLFPTRQLHGIPNEAPRHPALIPQTFGMLTKTRKIMYPLKENAHNVLLLKIVNVSEDSNHLNI